MLKKICAYPSFFCLLLCLTIIYLSAGAGNVNAYAAGPERVSLSCDEIFYEPETKTLSVNALLPDGQGALLIAASFFPDGRMKEKIIRQAESSGTYSFPFTKISNNFRIFAVNPDTLSPLTKELSKNREYNSSEMEVTTTVKTDLSMRSNQTADALCAMTADRLIAEQAFGTVERLISDTTVVSGNTVTKFEAVYGSKEAYENALATVSEAEAGYNALETSAAVLYELVGEYTDNDEILQKLSLQTGMDVMTAKNALSEIRLILESKYASAETDALGFTELCSSVRDNTGIYAGGGSADLSAKNLLITGSSLAVIAGDEKISLIIEPFNGRMYRDAHLLDIPAAKVYAAGRYGETVRLADILSLDGSQRSAYENYALEADADVLKATVTSLNRDDITGEELRAAAEAYFKTDSLGEHTDWEQARDAFVSEYRLSEEQLTALVGGYIEGTKNVFSDEIYKNYYESRGYNVYDRSQYISYNEETSRTRCIMDSSGDYVGLYEEWTNDRKTREAYYSENRRNGLNGLIYEKWWDSSTGYLASETTYSKGMPSLISGSGELSAGGVGAEGAAGAEDAGVDEQTSEDEEAAANAQASESEDAAAEDQASEIEEPAGGDDRPYIEEAAGEVPATDGKLFRRERHYWIRDDFGGNYSGQIQSEIVYQWRQDFYDEYVSKNPYDEQNAEPVGWFEIAYRFYYPSGKISMERMAMQSGEALRERDYTEGGELSQEKWYPFNNETYKFGFNHYAIFTWFTSVSLESPAYSRFSDEMKSSIKGHASVRFDSLNGIEDYYTPGMWNARWELQGEDTWVPIPGTIEIAYDTEQFWEPRNEDFEGNYLNPADFDYEGWEHSTGSGGSKSYHAVTTHYQYDKHNPKDDG